MKLSIVISCQPTVFEAISFEKDLEKSIKSFKEMGYQGVELAIRDPREIRIDEIKRITTELSMPVVAIGTGQVYLDEGISFSDSRKEVRKKAIERFKEHINLAAELRAQVVIGLIRGKSKKEESSLWENLLESLKICDDFAKGENVVLAIEPLNRYETNFINNVSQAIQLIKELEGEQLRVLLDTFHMNIEEPNMLESLRVSRDYLSHVHVADSNRYAPGNGHIDFSSIINCLKEIGYQGFLSSEILPLPDLDTAAFQSYEHLYPFLIKNSD